jgi:hypothetical protein
MADVDGAIFAGFAGLQIQAHKLIPITTMNSDEKQR